MRILFTGGGTLGPVAPLLAIAEALRGQADVELLGLVGTRYGPEREFAHRVGLRFFPITGGKLRRYWDLHNFAAPFEVAIGFFEALHLLHELCPTIVVSGGGFIGVPVILAAWFLRIPAITHQQDAWPSLANRLIAPFVKKITVTFSETARAFPKKKTVVTGNPVRPSVGGGDAGRAQARFGLEPNLPTLMVFGGGTGARSLNEIVWSSLSELTEFCQIIHSTGIGKGQGEEKHSHILKNMRMCIPDRYHDIELLTHEMADAYAVAGLVVARGGMGTITELAALGKPAIIVPLPGTHQEENARYLASRDAAVVVPQSELTTEQLVVTIRSLLDDTVRRQALGDKIRTMNPPDALERMLSVIASSAK